ncbi:MAG: hypothetical protein QJR07_19910 [Acetobacteraceae bacterium]|nr:hypothetical protein [Acetobacteraceae bacterium]
MARAERPQPARPAARHAASSGHRRRPVWGASVRVAAAVALVAVGWAAGRLVPGRPAEPTPGAVDELTRVRLERDLWRSVSAPGAAVMPLATDEGVAGAVAYASVQGDERGCWVRLVAEGLPDPPSGMRYAAWVSTRGGEWRLAGELSKAGSARWELSVRIDTPPAQLGTLQVVLQSDQAASPGSGRAIVWGQLWPAGQDW